MLYFLLPFLTKKHAAQKTHQVFSYNPKIQISYPHMISSDNYVSGFYSKHRNIQPMGQVIS